MDEFKFQDRLGGRSFRYVGAILPADQSNDRLMGEFCRRTVSTIWHYHGGCLVGKVVDRKFRVMGIGSLRVVDSSTFSISPGTNPQATVLMLGRWALGITFVRHCFEMEMSCEGFANCLLVLAGTWGCRLSERGDRTQSSLLKLRAFCAATDVLSILLPCLTILLIYTSLLKIQWRLV